MTPIEVSVQTADFDLNHEIGTMRARHSQIGAIVSFVGLVREMHAGDTLQSLFLEHYPGMTEKALQKIAETAAGRWPLLAIRVIHRVGTLAVNEQIVMVLTAAMHRDAAYAANMFIMDYLKTEAPFWKKEQTASGAEWVEARVSDLEKAEAWQEIK